MDMKLQKVLFFVVFAVMSLELQSVRRSEERAYRELVNKNVAAIQPGQHDAWNKIHADFVKAQRAKRAGIKQR